MKRSLLVAGLVLTIATSVISGTLAAYNVTVDDLAPDSVMAKSFVLTAEKSNASAFVNEKIAPGDSKEIPFKVEGTSETGMDVVIAINVSNLLKTAIDPLEYKLYKKDAMTAPLTLVKTDGKLEYKGLSFTNSGVLETGEFILVVAWPLGTKTNDDTDFQGSTHGNTVEIVVSGFQTGVNPAD